MLEISVLGPLVASAQGKSILPSATKPRQILALLALRAGEVIPVSTFMEEIWGEAPPRSAVTTLQTYVLQLRRLVEAAEPTRPAKEIITTRFNGYCLAADMVRVDAHRYLGLAEQANAAFQAGDLPRTATLSRQALSLWSGPVLVDVGRGMPLDIEASCLEQSRLSLLVTGLEAELELGKHQAMLGELSMLTARNPTHENLCAIFMTALYRCGQQSRALEAFNHLRSALGGRLGVEPSARLRTLQHSILTSDPLLELTGLGVSGRVSFGPVAHGVAVV